MKADSGAKDLTEWTVTEGAKAFSDKPDRDSVFAKFVRDLLPQTKPDHGDQGTNDWPAQPAVVGKVGQVNGTTPRKLERPTDVVKKDMPNVSDGDSVTSSLPYSAPDGGYVDLDSRNRRTVPEEPPSRLKTPPSERPGGTASQSKDRNEAVNGLTFAAIPGYDC